MPTAILHLLGTAQLEGTGIARIVAALASNLDPAKYKVHAWFLGPPGPLVEELQEAGVAAISVNWWRGDRDPAGAYRFWRRLGNLDFAVVHQHFGARSVRRLVRLRSDAPIVVHLHGRISESISARSIPIAVRGADTVIAVSRATALQLPALQPVVVYSGVESLKETESGNKSARTTTIIGAACRLVPLKGLTYLIRAVESLQAEFPNFQLEIAGTGPQRDDLEREVGRLNLSERVRFLGWQPDLRPVLRGWDIFVIPSLDEGLPVAALEAMAEGLPIVGTSVGGLPELIEDGKTGCLVAPSDVSALAKSLRLLILNSECRLAMGAAGRQRAREQFSIGRMVDGFAAVYASLTPSPQIQLTR